MTTIRATEVLHSDAFRRRIINLREKFSELDNLLNDVVELVRLDYLPETPLDSAIPNVFGVFLDYPPLGPAGLKRFRLIYHATARKPSPLEPYRTVTLIAIDEV